MTEFKIANESTCKHYMKKRMQKITHLNPDSTVGLYTHTNTVQGGGGGGLKTIIE